MPTGGSEGTEDWECGNIVSLWKWEKPTLKPESGIPLILMEYHILAPFSPLNCHEFQFAEINACGL